LALRLTCYIKEDDWDGSQEFTIPHEIREIIGTEAQKLYPSFVEAEGEELENKADAFAAALLMEWVSFKADMISSGLDPLFLHEKYHKSYIAIISRMATILCGKGGFPFWGSVLQEQTNREKDCFIAGCFHRSPKYLPKVRYAIPNFIFPKRGQLVPISGNLATCFEQHNPILIRRLTGLDFWNKYCLSVIIRPVIWANRVAKIIIIAIPEAYLPRLRPQLQIVSPTYIEESFQFI